VVLLRDGIEATGDRLAALLVGRLGVSSVTARECCAGCRVGEAAAGSICAIYSICSPRSSGLVHAGRVLPMRSP
jgi:hypothetical protein